MMRVAPSLVGLTILCASHAAYAESSFSRGGAIGLGVAAFSLDDIFQAGAAMTAEAHLHHRSGFTVRFVGDLTLTDFDRTKEWAKAGYTVGEFSVNGFKDVTSWIGRGGDSGTTFLRALGGIFAYTFLTLTLFISGALFLISPFGSVTSIHTAISGGYTHHIGDLTIHGDAGFGHVVFFDPETNDGFSGWAPSVAAGFDISGIGFGVRAFFSPDALHEGTRKTLVAATGTVQYVF